jgi:hypothetical protein
VGEPNPNPRTIRFHVQGDVDDVALKTYTVAMNCLGDLHSGPLSQGWASVDLRSEHGMFASNGVYFVTATPSRHGIEGRPFLVKIAVLR